MRTVSLLTVCPGDLTSFTASHVVQRAQALGLVQVKVVDIRESTPGSFRAVDDSPYGGGRGMILRIDAVKRALDRVLRERESDMTESSYELPHIVLLSPIGKPYTQTQARSLAEQLEHQDLVLIAGHYEGIDHRVMDYVDEVISLGDFVLTGGEIPAMVVTDSVLRLLPGVLRENSSETESFENGLLEYPQYTRPAEFEGKPVPGVLLSGDHEAIRRWRQEASLALTEKYRPDLLEISSEE